MPRWGEQQQAEPLWKTKPAPGGEGQKRGLGMEEGCSGDTDVAVEVEQEEVASSQHTRKHWDTSGRTAGAAGHSSSRCSRATLAREGPRGNQNRRDLSQDLEIPSAGVFFQPNQPFVLPRCGRCAWRGGTGWQDGHGGNTSVPGGTAVLWLRALADRSQRHQWWGRLVLGRLDCLGTCSSLGGAIPGGCWGPGLLSKYWDPAWVHEKGVSGGSTSWSPQRKGCQGSPVGPATC